MELEERRKRAEERHRQYNALTLEQKLERAIERGGPDSREAKKLKKQLEAKKDATKSK